MRPKFKHDDRPKIGGSSFLTGSTTWKLACTRWPLHSTSSVHILTDVNGEPSFPDKALDVRSVINLFIDLYTSIGKIFACEPVSNLQLITLPEFTTFNCVYASLFLIHVLVLAIQSMKNSLVSKLSSTSSCTFKFDIQFTSSSENSHDSDWHT